MPSSSQTSGALSGAASGAAAGSAILPGWGTAIGAVIGGVSGYFGAGKKVDINKIITDAQNTAKANLQNSINLENQFLPGTSMLRRQSNELNSNLATGSTAAQRVQGQLLDQAGRPITDPGAAVNNPLTVGSLNSILNSLNKGGKLDPDVQAQAVQAALQKGGAAGISGSGTGRGLVARDLGLTSLQLLQSRQNQAAQVGNQYGQLALQGQGLQLSDFMQRLAGVSGAVGQQQSYALGLGNLMAATPYPNSGLGPGQTASLAIGANAQANAIAQQNQANAAGAMTSVAGAVQAAGGIANLFKQSGGYQTVDSGGTFASNSTGRTSL